MDISTIGLKVDASGVITATGKLDQFTAAGGRAEAAADALGDQAAQTSAQVKGLGTSAGDAAAKSDRLAAAALKNAAAAKSAGVSVGQYNAALRTLPAQLTDIFTGLTSGQSPFLVLIQQGGQLKDSFGGIVPAARALAGAISPLAIGLGALGAATAAVAAGIVTGQRQTEELVRSIALYGRQSGVTAGQIGLLADAQDRLSGTRTKAEAVLTSLATTGRVGAEQLSEFARITIEAERTLGLGAEQIAKDFEALGKDPTRASEKLTESLGYLTVATANQIRELERAGDLTEAARVAQEAFADAIRDRTGEMVGNVSRVTQALQGVKSLYGEIVESVTSIGRVVGPEAELQQLQGQRGSRALGEGYGQRGPGAGQFQRSDARERELQIIVDRNRAQAERLRLEKEIQDAARQAAEENTRYVQDALTQQEKLNQALADYRGNVEAIRKADTIRKPGEPAQAPSPAEIAKVEAAIRARFVDPGVDKAAQAVAEARREFAQLEADLRAQVETFGQTNSAVLAYRLSLGDLSGDLRLLGDAGGETARSLVDQAEKLDQLRARQDEFNRSQREAQQFAQGVLRRGQETDIRGSVESVVRAGEGGGIGAFGDVQNRIADANDTESKRFDEESKRLQDSFDRRLIDQATYHEALEAAEREHQSRLSDIESAGQDAKKGLYKNAFDAISDLGSDFQSSVLSQSKKGFEISKAISIAQATVKTYDAAIGAYNALVGIPIVGPGLAVGAAGAAVAFGLAQVAAINSTQFQGRRYGGPVKAGGLYDFVEGGDPELIKIGSRTLLAMGNQDGHVTPAKTAQASIPVPNPAVASVAGSRASNGANIKVEIIDQVGVKVTPTITEGPNGEILERFVISTMTKEFSEQGRSFNTLREMTGLRVIPR